MVSSRVVFPDQVGPEITTTSPGLRSRLTEVKTPGTSRFDTEIESLDPLDLGPPIANLAAKMPARSRAVSKSGIRMEKRFSDRSLFALLMRRAASSKLGRVARPIASAASSPDPDVLAKLTIFAVGIRADSEPRIRMPAANGRAL
jgi:hypothetical protein